MIFPITALYASICGVLILLLSMRVVILRRKFMVGIGDGDQHDLKRSIRVHANALEYIPIALILLALYEANSGIVWLLHAAGIALVISRALHAQGLSKTPKTSFGRFVGTLFTWIVILVLSIANIVLLY